MNIIATDILNGTFQQAKGCIIDLVTNGVSSIVPICQIPFLPIQKIYYHISCMTDDASLFPQEISKQCAGYLEKISDNDTAKSIFYIYGSNLHDHIIDLGKYGAPCSILEDCSGVSLPTTSDSNYSDIYYAIIPVVSAIFAFGGMCWKIRKDRKYGDETAEDNEHTKNIELAADGLNNTPNLLNNCYAENKCEDYDIVELVGDAEVV